MVGQSDELTCRVWSRTRVPKLKTIWCTTKVCFDPSTALTAGLNQTLSKIMCDNFSLEKCFTFTPSYFLLLLHHFHSYGLNISIFQYPHKRKPSVSSSGEKEQTKVPHQDTNGRPQSANFRLPAWNLSTLPTCRWLIIRDKKFITATNKPLNDWWSLRGKMILTASLQRTTTDSNGICFFVGNH